MKPTKPIDRLLSILTYRRQHNSKGERAFIDAYLKDFETLNNEDGEVIAFIYDNHSKKAKTNILWSCHIDTMHHKNPDEITQEVFIDPFNTAFVDHTSDCLGADDGAGVFLLLEMINANVEGTYIFHRGEEKGCWGSSQVAELYPDFLKSFTHAIAFDRRANTSIITHQRGERCASDEVGNQLIKLFGLGYQLDDTGVYTDTAEYTHLIGECLNISIGYNHEHTSQETLDTNHVLNLRDIIVAYDWARQALPSVRKPEPRRTYSSFGFYGAHNRTLSHDQISYEDLLYTDHKTLTDFIKKSKPDDVANLIYDLLDQIQYLEDGQYYAYQDGQGDFETLDRTSINY